MLHHTYERTCKGGPYDYYPKAISPVVTIVADNVWLTMAGFIVLETDPFGGRLHVICIERSNRKEQKEK